MLDSERLHIRKFNIGDAPFILELLNTPGWLKYIGDKKVYTLKDAHNYLTSGPLEAYANSSYGLMALELLHSSELIGTCGLLKRDYLDFPDIGFALLPEYYRRGFISEASKAILDWYNRTESLSAIQAITQVGNKASIGLLLKMGFQQLEPTVRDEETINLFQKNL